MNKIFLILKHEFIHMVRTKSFVILTLAFPAIALLGIGIFQIVQGALPEEIEVLTIGYVDQAGGFDKYTSQTPEITLLAYVTQEEANRKSENTSLSPGTIYPMAWLPAIHCRRNWSQRIEPTGPFEISCSATSWKDRRPPR